MDIKCTEHAHKLSKVIQAAASKNLLKKAVFSKSQDKSIQKAVATVLTIGGKLCLQIEYFHCFPLLSSSVIIIEPDGKASKLDILFISSLKRSMVASTFE